MITMFRVTENRLEGRMQTEQCHEYRTEEEGSFTYNELTVPTVNATKMSVQQQQHMKDKFSEYSEYTV
jgi:hypothetical protein